MPTSCMNTPPNHHAHLGSSLQLTPDGDGANLPRPLASPNILWKLLHRTHAKSTYTPNSLDSAFQRHVAHYYVMLPVRSNFIPQHTYII